MASINNLVEAGSPEMVSVTELGNGMMRPSTHLLNARTTPCARVVVMLLLLFRYFALEDDKKNKMMSNSVSTREKGKERKEDEHTQIIFKVNKQRRYSFGLLFRVLYCPITNLFN